MDTLDESSLAMTPANASPPDFDFNLPCRYFKSSFARSLSLTNSGNNNNLCKSLDYDMRSNNNNIVNMTSLHKRDLAPPLPQRRLSQAGSLIQQQNEANTNSNNKQVLNDVVANNINKNISNMGNDKPPALPARRPLSLNNSLGYQNSNLSDENSEQKIQASLTQFQQHALKQAMNNNNSNASILPANSNHVHTNNNSNNKHNNNVSKQQQFNTNRINHFSLSNGNSNKNNNNTSSINCSNNSNFRRNNIVWPNQQNVEQDCNICDGDNDEDINSEYHDTITRSSLSDYHHYQNSHHQQQHQSHRIPTITTTNLTNNPQQQEQHQMSSYEVVNDTTTNVEAVILQNQVDTLQWQLKQVETSCDMYRAVMEEVARFLERYQSQKQLLQQQQQQQLQLQQQQQHQLAAHKHNNNNVNNNMEQIPRSKSLYQVYVAGGHEKSTTGGNNLLNETLSSTSATLAAAPTSTSSSTSYLRARSSTNLIDLKQTAGSTCNSNNKIKGHHSKDDHNFETGLTPSQSYSAFKDFTWRRSPKKVNDNRFNNPKSDDVEEKLNQEAFRLLRTIHNLLNTSQHQPDIAHHRHSLAPASALNLGRLSKAMSTTSVMTLPGAPMHNSTNLTMGSNSVGSTTPDSSTASPCIATAASNNATPSSNNLAPEMLFLRSANMRDSRLSLRSSTDSSVHSTSSVASSASSKVETDEEPTTPFHSPPNILTHKQQQHNHLAGSSTEDESGFSSISSFPDIGVALSSTMLSSTPSSGKARTLAKELKSLKTNEKCEVQTPESRNSTLKANVVGLPLNSSQDMSHRWDSPSKTYHNASTKFQRFSALTNEDSNTVLWV